MSIYMVQNFSNDRGEVAAAKVIVRPASVIRTVQVPDTEVSLTPEPNTLYQCGELNSLTVTIFPAVGTFWIWFTSGETPTTTVGIANFVAEKNKRYRIFVENGYASYDAWPAGGGN